MDYKKLNNYIGWLVFLIATATYIATLEPTTSLWDCGEYITTAYKLEVGHPPGAPLFMMLGRLFTFFGGDNPESAAYMVNLMSALSSSFTILFLFWSITMIGKKIMLVGDGSLFEAAKNILNKNEDRPTTLSAGQKWAVLGSGIIGGLAYTFTDSFWFSAVEGEVYAMSSFFTAIVVWAILKWESELTDKENQPENDELQSQNTNRWIVFIFLMIGLSIGVHLLNLLCIPAIAYIIYFKKYKATVQGFILTGIIGIATLGIIQAVLIPKTIQVAGSVERMFVNNLGMPFNTGAITFFVIITAIIVALLMFSKKTGKEVLNTATWSVSMIFIGYSCFAMIVIRSNANTPLDENDPENLVSLESYLKREQYGDWPIMYGQYFNSDYLRDEKGAPDYKNWNDRSNVYLKRFVVQKDTPKGKKDVNGFVKEEDAKAYVEANGGEITQKYYLAFDGTGKKPTYNPDHMTLFPRMYSSEPRHVQGYQSWSGYSPGDRLKKMRKSKEYKTGGPYEKYNLETIAKLPSMGENLNYFAEYQVGWMYWRYFMWNFAGRQNDEQGHGNAKDGNWISGLNFIDKHHVGDQSEAPVSVAENPSNNKFYLLPLVLGLIGFIFTLRKGSKSWWLIMLLFILTGFAVIVYLSQKPMEPRERDYAYAASFYAFSFWIGLSVLGLYDAFKNMQWKDLGIITGTLVVFSLILMVGGTAGGLGMLFISTLITIAFAVMIAMRQGIKNEAQSAIFATLVCLPVPIIMGVQGWDDHDRSNRYTAQALAENYLNSCSDGSIVFTNGDNDTFPLWYLQEVEGKKTSVRVCNLSLLNTDWYTTQMKNRAYDSAPLPISFEEHEYRQNANLDYLIVASTSAIMSRFEMPEADFYKLVDQKIKYNPELFKTGFKAATSNLYAILSNSNLAKTNAATVENIKNYDETGTYKGFREFIISLLTDQGQLGIQPEESQAIENVLLTFDASFDYLPADFVMDYVRNPANSYKVRQGDDFMTPFPTTGLTLPIDKAQIIAQNSDSIVGNEVVAEKDYDRIVDVMRWKLPKQTIYKADILILDMVAHFNWERNMYFASSAATDTYMGLENYFYGEGLVYKLVPIKINKNRNPNSLGEINKEVMYDNLLNNFKWGNMEKEGVLVDYYTRRTFANNSRVQFSVLADAYVEEFELEKQKVDFFAQVLAQNEGSPEDSIQTPVGIFVRGEIPAKMKESEKIMAFNKEKVVEVLEKSFTVIPNNKVPYARIIPYYISAYYSVGEIEKGRQYANDALDVYADEMNYYTSIDPEFSGTFIQDIFGTYRSILTIWQLSGPSDYNQSELTDEVTYTKAQALLKEYMLKLKKTRFDRAYKNTYDQTFGPLFKQLDPILMYQ